MNDQKGSLEMLNILISILSSLLLTRRVVWCEAWRQLSAVVGVQTLALDSRNWILALPLIICVTAGQLFDFSVLQLCHLYNGAHSTRLRSFLCGLHD